MVHREGYGKDWSNWDTFINYKWPKPEKIKYHNWCPFLSPKGRWLAFYNTSYTDIHIVDLEDNMKIVVEHFYSHNSFEKNDDGSFKKDEKGWAIQNPDHFYNGFHTNVATYVPHFMYYHVTTQDREDKKLPEPWLQITHGDSDFLEFDPNNPEKIYEIDQSVERYIHHESQIQLASLPLAFNQYTQWAADFEFYCDIIDLSDVDNGNIKLVDIPSFIMPRDCDHIRNFVNVQYLGGSTANPDTAYKAANISILEETKCHRFYPAGGKNSEPRILDANNQDNPKYKLKDKLPWEETKERFDKLDAERKANKIKAEVQ